MWTPSFSAEELEFFATLKTQVTILPNFSTTDEIFLLSGKVGPFRAGLDTPVPLWLALNLKTNQKCRIFQPFWFQKDTLNRFLQTEKNNKQQLINLQVDEFFQISYIFLSKARDEIKNIHQVKAIIESLQNIRREKIRKLFEQNSGAVKLKNLTPYEANKIREPMSKLQIMVDKIKKPVEGQKRT